MTFLETKLLEYFRACGDKERIAIFETASYLADHHSDLPADLDDVQTSMSAGQIVSLYESMNSEYKFRLARYAQELDTLNNRMTDPASGPEDHPQPTQNLRPHASYRESPLVITAQKAIVPKNYQLTTEDIYTLYDIIRSDGKHDPFNALCFAFDYGFVKGNRATRRGKVKAL